MKAVLRLPDDKTPDCLIKEGRQKAGKYCRDSESSTQSPRQRFANLCEIYRNFAIAYDKAAENFSLPTYKARGNGNATPDKEQQMAHVITAVYHTKGAMSGVYDRMQALIEVDPSLERECGSYAYAESVFNQDLSAIFHVYSTRGEESQRPLRHVPGVIAACDNMIKRLRNIKPA